MAETLEKLPDLFLFSDEPTHGSVDDALQLKGFSRTIAAAAIGSPGPFTIGVFAGWGLGKTSILHQARSIINESSNTQHAATAWVNAWRFEQEEHPIVPIILSILDGISTKLGTKSPSKPDEKFLANAHRALRAIIYGFGFRGKIADPLTGTEIGLDASAKDMIERYEKLAPTPDPLVEKSLYYHAYEILDGILSEKPFKKPPYPKIVIFIDDLDRCLPDKALKVFESIKLVLSQRGFVFVLAVDRDVIDAFLTKRYRDEFGVAEKLHHGEHYMDKIIQLPLHVPHHEGRFEDYIRNLIAADGAKKPSIQGKQLKAKERKVFSSLITPLAAGTDRNPRTLIRTLNRLLTDKFLWDQLPSEHRDGRPIENADELLRFAAISRILENTIGVHHTRALVRNNDLCAGLISFLKDFGKERSFPSAKDRSIVGKRSADDLEREIVVRIEGNSAIRELLLSDIGKSWLEEPHKRKDVDGFLDSTRDLTEVGYAAELNARAIASEFDGDFENAERFYKQSIDADPNGAESLSNYANFLHKIRRDYAAAEMFYRRATETDPRNVGNILDFAIFLADIRKNYDAAEVYFKRAVNIDPENTAALGNYAIFLAHNRDDPDAAASFHKLAIKSSPDNGHALGNYGQFLIGRGETAEGVNLLRRGWSLLFERQFNHKAEFAYSLWLGSVLDGAEESIWECAFKYLIKEGFTRVYWNFDAMLAQAEKKLPPEGFAYARVLADAFLEETKEAELEKLPRWRAVVPVHPDLVNPNGTLRGGWQS